MFLSHLSTLDRDAPNLPEAIQRGLRFLADTDIAALPVGRVDIDGDAIFALVQEYETEPKGRRRPEAHVRHLDIQYVAEGREVIGYAPINRGGAIAEDLLAQRDVVFYASVDGESDLVMEAGNWAVFYPNDIHRPCCLVGTSGKVRKVVVKIRL